MSVALLDAEYYAVVVYDWVSSTGLGLLVEFSSIHRDPSFKKLILIELLSTIDGKRPC